MKITLSFSDPYQSNFIMSPYLLLLFLVHVHVFKRYSKQHFHLLNYFGQNKHCLPPNQYFSIFTVSKCILGYMRDVLKMSRIFSIFCIERYPYHSCSRRKITKVFTCNKWNTANATSSYQKFPEHAYLKYSNSFVS